jgi:hypothetical protein
MKKKNKKVVSSKTKIPGLKQGSCGVILEPINDRGFAIKSIEGMLYSESKPLKRGKSKKLSKETVKKLMKKIRPSLQLMHIQRGLIYLLENYMHIVYDAADKSIDDGLQKILNRVKSTNSSKKNVIYVDFNKGAIH